MKSNGASQTFRLGELFCGPGGIGLGAKWALVDNGLEKYIISHAWATDYDRDTCETYRHNICPDNPKPIVCRDIRKLNLEKCAALFQFAFVTLGFSS